MRVKCKGEMHVNGNHVNILVYFPSVILPLSFRYPSVMLVYANIFENTVFNVNLTYVFSFRKSAWDAQTRAFNVCLNVSLTCT